MVLGMYNLISLFSPGALISGSVNVASDCGSLLTHPTRKVWGLTGHWELGEEGEMVGQDEESELWGNRPGQSGYFPFFSSFFPTYREE